MIGVRGGRYTVLWSIIAICTVIELVLSGADFGILGSSTARFDVFMLAAFWEGFLTDWPAQYPLHPAAMFLTHAFLHGSFLHMAINMASLAGLGKVTIVAIGQGKFLAVYLISAIGGAAAFALISDVDGPMVGASGALFGLLGLIIGREYRQARRRNTSLAPVVRTIGLLVVLNVVLWWATEGHLAWQAHLGGAVTGFLASFVVRSKPKRSAEG